jgi:cytoskeleton protein RodZ
VYDNLMFGWQLTMITIGDKLRAARIERGITLEQISDETKISLRYLDAIEACNPAGLPGAVFARNFARQYANYLGIKTLGIKASELDEQIRTAFPREDDSGPSPQTIPVTGSVSYPIEVAPLADPWNWNRIGLSALALFAVLGAGAAVFRILQEAPALFEAAREQVKAEESAAVNANLAATPTAELRIAQNTDGSAAHGDGISETTITISGNGMAVRVVAEQDTWISMSANGSHVFSELLKANQSRTISGVENARMVIGNAGGVKIATNGKDIGPIGLPGQVRVVMLSPEGPKIGTMPAI